MKIHKWETALDTDWQIQFRTQVMLEELIDAIPDHELRLQTRRRLDSPKPDEDEFERKDQWSQRSTVRKSF